MRLSLLPVLALVLCLLQSAVSFASQKVLRVGVSLSIPPWVIRESDSGIELDILREAFAEKDVQIQVSYVPFARAFDLFERGQIDVVVNAKKALYGGFLSKPVVSFRNVAISLAKKGFRKELTVDDLQGHSVIAFQKATELLGSEFGRVMSDNPHYEEVARQHLQLNLLFLREVDFIVLERSIFGYLWTEVVERHPYTKGYFQDVTFHELFPPNPYSYLFADQKMQQFFDRSLERMRSDGRYAAIFKRYESLIDLYDQREANAPSSR